MGKRRMQLLLSSLSAQFCSTRTRNCSLSRRRAAGGLHGTWSSGPACVVCSRTRDAGDSGRGGPKFDYCLGHISVASLSGKYYHRETNFLNSSGDSKLKRGKTWGPEIAALQHWARDERSSLSTSYGSQPGPRRAWLTPARPLLPLQPRDKLPPR